MSFLSQINWRYSTKKFDSSRKVSDTDLDTILEAIRLTPTSFGLQPYHFYVITNQEIKDKIQVVAWNQAQVGTSSHLIVMVARTDLMATSDEYFTQMSGGSPDVRAHLKGFEDMVTGTISMKEGAGAGLDWAARQVYIALGFGIAAAAELQIDSSPMEGFDPAAVGEILGLPETQKVVVMLPIGYRAEGEGPRGPEKVRFSRKALFTEVK